MSQSSQKFRIAVLISGGGTTLRNLIERIDDGRLDVKIAVVVSSNPRSPGIAIATAAGIPTAVCTGKQNDLETFSQAVLDHCRKAAVDLVVMGGFLRKLFIPDDFANRVINIHPSLIPAFCGKGFYGHYVHKAVIEYGAKISGCTVHFVDNQYDHGPIILQRVVPVADDDTPDTLAARVFAAECEAYPEAIRLFAAGRLKLAGRRVRIVE